MDEDDETADSDLILPSHTIILKTAYNEIAKVLEPLISNTIEYIKTQNNKVQYYKKHIILHMSFGRQIIEYEGLYHVFYHLLQKEIPHHFTLPDVSMWHYFQPSPHEYITHGSCLKLDRKSILLNMSLPPVLVDHQTVVKFDHRDYLDYSTFSKSLKLGYIPEHIIHFGT